MQFIFYQRTLNTGYNLRYWEELTIAFFIKVFMEHSILITVDDQRKIIYYYHKGFLKIEDIGSAWKRLLELKEFTQFGYNLLCDYSEADFAFSFGSADLIWKFFHSIKDVLDNKKEAIITSSPQATAISYLFENETSKKLNFTIKTFSTREVAIDWLCR